MSASAVLKLQKVGFTAEQVEALADFMDTQAASKADLGEGVHGLKSQIEEVEHKLTSKIEAVEHQLSSRIEAVEHRLELEIGSVRSEMSLMRADARQMEQRLIIKLGGMMVVMVGVVVAIVKLLPGGHP